MSDPSDPKDADAKVGVGTDNGTVQRHARMPSHSAVHLVRGSDSFSVDLINISATGVLVGRPTGFNFPVGALFVVDIVLTSGKTIYMEATITRVTGGEIALAFTKIPTENQVPLWELLGPFADKKEKR